MVDAHGYSTRQPHFGIIACPPCTLDFSCSEKCRCPGFNFPSRRSRRDSQTWMSKKRPWYGTNPGHGLPDLPDMEGPTQPRRSNGAYSTQPTWTLVLPPCISSPSSPPSPPLHTPHASFTQYQRTPMRFPSFVSPSSTPSLSSTKPPNAGLPMVSVVANSSF